MCKFQILTVIFSFGSWAGEKLFEVNHVSMIGDKFMVNLDKLEYTCRKWTITGIPCCHSLTAMRFLNINIEQHIPHWFLTSTYEETYIPLIYPVNGPKVWEMNSDIDVLPPPKRILPRRLMSAYFCPHSVFNIGYLIEFMCLKSDLIDNYDN